MFFRCLSLVLCAASLALAGQSTLRVCADPNNLPFSNQRGEGFENKLAEMVALATGQKLEYTWWSERKSFLRDSLNAGRCDVVMGVPTSLSSVAVSRPYYRSTYVFVSRHAGKLQVSSLTDPRLQHCRIGIQVVGNDYAPPAVALARGGLAKNIVGFSLFGPYGDANPARKIVDAVARGDVDVAVVWGPLAGYFAKSAPQKLDIVPISPPTYLGVPFTYDISIGVRKQDTALEAELNQVLQSHADVVRRILARYGVPQVP